MKLLVVLPCTGMVQGKTTGNALAKYVQFFKMKHGWLQFSSIWRHAESVSNAINIYDQKEWIKTGKGGKFLYLNSESADGAVAEPEFDTDLQNIAKALQKIPIKFRSEISRQTVSFIGLLYNFLKKK